MKGRYLRQYRRDARVTLDAIAVRMGVSKPRVSQIEQQDTVTLDVAERFVQAVDAIDAERAGRVPDVYSFRVYVEGGAGGPVPLEAWLKEQEIEP